LLVQQVVERYFGRAVFVKENFGSSKLAERFGITRYPSCSWMTSSSHVPGTLDSPGRVRRTAATRRGRTLRARSGSRPTLGRTIDLVLAGKKDEAFREWMPELGKP
jgi:hypothetical protein